jgi:chlorite dismutase
MRVGQLAEGAPFPFEMHTPLVHPAVMTSDENATPKIDVWERTKGYTGPAEGMNRRLFMQLFVFDCDPSEGPAKATEQLDSALSKQGIGAVIYRDMNNPFGIGVLSWSEEPADFVTRFRPCFEGMKSLSIRHDFTMVGRSYATGYEPDLEYWLIRRPIETVLNEQWPWAVWYPLRRSGEFARLDPKEQGSILREHAEIGKAYGQQDLAHDVRLACHGIDASDNEFLIGLIGQDLHPLSHVVQAMRKTKQTSQYITQMGPFFVGHAVSRHSG